MSPQPATFLQEYYPLLRPGKSPFPWMIDLMSRLVCGTEPKLADLPSGSGKTDIAVVWLILTF